MSTIEKGEINISPMETKHFDAVIAIYNKIREQRITGPQSSRSTDAGILTPEDIVASTEPGSPLDLSFVADINGQIVGLIWGRLAYAGIPIKQMGLIHMLIVDPDYQRQGIARRLIEALAQRCFAKGFDTIRTIISDQDWELQNFFDNLGFKHSGLAIYTKTVEY